MATAPKPTNGDPAPAPAPAAPSYKPGGVAGTTMTEAEAIALVNAGKGDTEAKHPEGGGKPETKKAE